MSTYAGSIAQVDTSKYAAILNQNKKSQMDLDVESFLQLIVAQIQNQDVLGTGGESGSSSSGDFANQLLQMTLVQSLDDMMTMNMTSYAMSMVGKEVVVARLDGGEVIEDAGVVTGVSIYGDEPILHVNGQDYPLSSVMTVGTTEPKEDRVEELLEDILEELRKPEPEPEEPDPTDGVQQNPTDGVQQQNPPADGSDPVNQNPPADDGGTGGGTDTTTGGGETDNGGETA